MAVNVAVTRDGTESNVEPITIATATAPAAFLSEVTNGVAWVTGIECATTECAVKAGTEYELWVTGLGAKNVAQQDGVPATFAGLLTPLEVPGGPASCVLTIGGQTATVNYCGAAPGGIIDQVNFIYPMGGFTGLAYLDATAHGWGCNWEISGSGADRGAAPLGRSS